MTSCKAICATLLLTALAVVPVASAANTATIKFVGVGSSAMYTISAVAAANDLAGGATAHHFSAKAGSCGTGVNCGQMKDQRSTLIPIEAGQIWIVWSTLSGSNYNVWAYLQVDSVVGNRAF